MKPRTITAFFFAVAMVMGTYGGRETFYPLLLIISVGCLWELLEMLLPKEERFRMLRKMIGCLVGVLPVFWAAMSVLFSGFCGHSTQEEIRMGHRENHFHAAAELALFLAILIPILLVSELFLRSKSPIQHIGHYLMGLFYIGLPVALAFSIVTPDAWYSSNRVTGLFLLVWTNDTGAYLIDSQMGKRMLFGRISSKKTWEGTVGGAAFTVVTAWCVSFFLHDFTIVQWLVLGVIAVVGSNLGHLVNSMLKHSVGVVDSGGIWPNQGGFLDHFYPFILSLPFFWLVLQIWVF